MHHLLENLILYSNNNDSVISKVGELCKGAKNIESNSNGLAHEIIRDILKMSSEYGFNGNLWQSCVAHYIAFNENAFSLSLENQKEPINDVFGAKDCETLDKIFNFDFKDIEAALRIDYFSSLSKYEGKFEATDAGKEIEELKEALQSSEDFFKTISKFYKSHGVGTLGLSKAFTIKVDGEKAGFVPVKSLENIKLSDLIGYEVQKNKLIDNTEAFLKRKPANNVLLFGDGGTGKSTSIRAIANQYHNDGLRIIQVYRHQMKYLSQIIASIKTRNYRFIIYMDDLSFEDFETEYKYLKAVIEGGLEPRPENVLIYATSNRRHLIKETWKDRDDIEHVGDIHRSDSIEEKVSLAARFGVQIYYGKPTNEEFHQIVETLAKREGVKLSTEELHAEANKWQIRHGGVSGRSARQLIDYIKGTEEDTK